MIRLLVTLAVSLLACTPGQTQSTKDEIHLRATVQDVVPLTDFSGEITPVDFGPRFALTVRIESVDPAVGSFTPGAVVAYAIHSPALLFGEDATKGKMYDFSLQRETKHSETRFFGLKVLRITSTTTLEQTRYSPPRSLDDDSTRDKFLTQWYSAALKALHEPSLWELSKSQKGESYRFLWLRTFHHPVVVRIDVRADGSSQLFAKMTSGAGGYKPGLLTENTSVELTRVLTDRFLNELRKEAFWELEPRQRESGGCDGAEWIIEGVRGGSYRVVVRWTPMNGPVRDLGLFMLENLANMKIPADEIY